MPATASHTHDIVSKTWCSQQQSSKSVECHNVTLDLSLFHIYFRLGTVLQAKALNIAGNLGSFVNQCPTCTGVNAAGDAGDTSPPIFWLVGTSMGISPPKFLCTFGYSRPTLVALCSLKQISFGHKMPHCRQFVSVTQVDSGLTRLQQSVHW